MYRCEFILPIFENSSHARTSVRLLAASLSRNLFDGSITILTRFDDPIFKVERKQVQELHVPRVFKTSAFPAPPDSSLELIWDAIDLLDADESAWLTLVTSGAIALRGVDHLFPGAYGLTPDSKCDMLIPQSDRAGTKGGLLSIRGSVLRNFVRSHPSLGEPESFNLLAQLLENGVNYGYFEKGEICAPAANSIDWRKISDAALVLTHEWPVLLENSFLSSLYLNHVLNSESGFFLQTLDP